MRVTSKGQVTIPVRIRRKLRIKANTQVDFVERDGEVVLEVREPEGPKETFEEWLKRVQGAWNSDLTTEDVMRLTRGDEWPDGPY